MVSQKFALMNRRPTLGANGHHRVPPIARHHGDSAEHASHDTCGFVCPISDTVSHARDRTRKLYDQ